MRGSARDLKRHPVLALAAVSSCRTSTSSRRLPIALMLLVGATQAMAQHNAKLLSGLEKSGLALKRGEGGIGLLHHQLRKRHTFIEQGAGKMVVDGKIKIKRSQDGVKGFDHHTVILADDTRIEADVVVVAI
jgi:hypothetical protein